MLLARGAPSMRGRSAARFRRSASILARSSAGRYASRSRQPLLASVIALLSLDHVHQRAEGTISGRCPLLEKHDPPSCATLPLLMAPPALRADRRNERGAPGRAGAARLARGGLLLGMAPAPRQGLRAASAGGSHPRQRGRPSASTPRPRCGRRSRRTPSRYGRSSTSSSGRSPARGGGSSASEVPVRPVARIARWRTVAKIRLAKSPRCGNVTAGCCGPCSRSMQ